MPYPTSLSIAVGESRDQSSVYHSG